MNRIFTICLFFLSFSATAQLKNISVGLSGALPLLPTKEESQSLQMQYPTSTGFTTYTSTVDMKQSFTDSKGFSLKVSANHDLTSNYYFSSGLTATYLEWKRNTELHSFLSPTGPQEPARKPMGDIIWRDADGISHPANFSTDPKIGKGSFIFVQIPVLVGRQFLKEKLQLKAGIMNSFLLSAREYQTEYSYMTGISVEKNSTASHYQAYSLGTVVEASFKLTQHLAVNASGQHNLTRIFKDNTSSLSKTRLSILSLGVEYYF